MTSQVSRKQAKYSRHFSLVLCAALLPCGITSTTLAVESSDVVTPLVAMPLAEPNPALGADDKIHLAYEFVLMNMAPGVVTIEKVETLDAASDAVVGTLSGDALAQMIKPNGGAKGPELQGGGSGILFMDVTLARDATVPKAIKHRFEMTVAQAPAQEVSLDADPSPRPPQDVSFVSDPLPVGPAAVVVAPPVKGSRWVIGGGCCTPIGYHRGATLPINGTLHVPERFAIDFVQLNAKDMLYTGDMHKVEDYEFFGDEIYAAADGTVVATEDDLPEQIPGKLPEDATIQMAAGNHVVVDIGEGRFAFYAHMQPGSIKVKLGDKVKTGQVLGLLGNTGNTDTPHLHFHIMDGPSPLLSNGLPFLFTTFTGEGHLVDEQPLFTGGVVTIDKSALAGLHENEFPLHDQVVSFP
jgi:murein DD-endopeptidase MepM/ murein hydrolase activator NlpD